MTKNEIEQQMKDRIANGLDPLTGTPWALCSWDGVTLGTDGCVCKGCGNPVTLDADGRWIYK